jgi:hypothetical protein
MIRIPFDRCVILTTLDFAQILDRLESAIYDPNFLSQSDPKIAPKYQHYFGQIQGFKFLANRIVGYKYFHLPAFLSPTIEGKIDSLHHGYEISLTIKLNNITVALMLTWLGGVLTAISSVLDNILADSKNYQYLTTLEIIIFGYLLVVAYFYFEAWRATKFFRTLFVKRFAGTIESGVVDRSIWRSDFNFQDVRKSRSLTDTLRKNLPSFPDRWRSLSPGETERESSVSPATEYPNPNE